MNNSRLAYDNVPLTLEESVNPEEYRERQATVVRTIEAIDALNKSAEWSTLKKEIFQDRVESLERQMKNESEANTLKDSELYRLQGRLFEARKYDLDKLRESLMLELSKLKVLTQPTER